MFGQGASERSWGNSRNIVVVEKSWSVVGGRGIVCIQSHQLVKYLVMRFMMTSSSLETLSSRPTKC